MFGLLIINTQEKFNHEPKREEFYHEPHELRANQIEIRVSYMLATLLSCEGKMYA